MSKEYEDWDNRLIQYTVCDTESIHARPKWESKEELYQDIKDRLIGELALERLLRHLQNQADLSEEQ